MRILVVDCNACYAKRIKRILEENVTAAQVDCVMNTIAMKRRLSGNHYELVLVDVQMVMHAGLTESDIHAIQVEFNTHIIIWGSTNKQTAIDHFLNMSNIMPKPSLYQEKALATVVMQSASK